MKQDKQKWEISHDKRVFAEPTVTRRQNNKTHISIQLKFRLKQVWAISGQRATLGQPQRFQWSAKVFSVIFKLDIYCNLEDWWRSQQATSFLISKNLLKSVKSYIGLIEFLALNKIYLHKNYYDKTFSVYRYCFVLSILRSNCKVRPSAKRGLLKVAPSQINCLPLG